MKSATMMSADEAWADPTTRYGTQVCNLRDGWQDNAMLCYIDLLAGLDGWAGMQHFASGLLHYRCYFAR
jgi:hypothetical protein